MTRLADLELCVSAAESGSRSSAVRRLGISPARASNSITRLEETFCGQLFVSSARSLWLAVEGEASLVVNTFAMFRPGR